MSQLARLHQEFEDVTGLSKRLNQSLLIAKRMASGRPPAPDPKKLEWAETGLAEVLRTLLQRSEEGLRRPWAGDVLDQLSKEIGRSQVETRSELEACLERVLKGASHLDSVDLRLLDHIGTVLDQSSAALYRQLIRA